MGTLANGYSCNYCYKLVKIISKYIILLNFIKVIASQAIITGCFSLLSQAGSLGFCPPLHVRHTSEKMFGQIYVPVSFILFYFFNKINFLNKKDNKLDINVFNNIYDSLF